MHISIKVLHCPYLFTYSLWQFSNVRKGQKHPPKSGPSTASVFGSIKSQMKFLSILGKSGHAAYLIKHCRQNLLICNGSGFFPSIFSVIFETLSMKFWISWSQHKKTYQFWGFSIIPYKIKFFISLGQCHLQAKPCWHPFPHPACLTQLLQMKTGNKKWTVTQERF